MRRPGGSLTESISLRPVVAFALFLLLLPALSLAHHPDGEPFGPHEEDPEEYVKEEDASWDGEDEPEHLDPSEPADRADAHDHDDHGGASAPMRY